MCIATKIERNREEMLTKLENSMNLFTRNLKLKELDIDFLTIYKNFYESKIRQTQLDEDIEQLFSNYGKNKNSIKKYKHLFKQGIYLSFINLITLTLRK